MYMSAKFCGSFGLCSPLQGEPYSVEWINVTFVSEKQQCEALFSLCEAKAAFRGPCYKIGIACLLVLCETKAIQMTEHLAF